MPNYALKSGILSSEIVKRVNFLCFTHILGQFDEIFYVRTPKLRRLRNY